MKSANPKYVFLSAESSNEKEDGPLLKNLPKGTKTLIKTLALVVIVAIANEVVEVAAQALFGGASAVTPQYGQYDTIMGIMGCAIVAL